ncbi:MAG: NERD domain-containing protein [Gammaproteobacteria bacterium]|nr:NERD domain-containing protein [Gammaproteobacteria bacterium]MDH3767614.1 NERD domain-containing protein [Gammaproteobacteria bacterium]
MTPELTATLSVVAASAGLIAFISRSRGRARRYLLKTIRAISHDYLERVLVPDGLDGKIEIDYLLLTSRGLLVLDVKEVGGVVFAGTALDRWAVMDGTERFKINNPIGPSMARIVAVKRLVPDLPVHGRIVFTQETDFRGDELPQVVSVDELRKQFPPPQTAAADRPIDAFYSDWLKLREVAAAA